MKWYIIVLIVLLSMSTGIIGYLYVKDSNESDRTIAELNDLHAALQRDYERTRTELRLYRKWVDGLSSGNKQLRKLYRDLEAANQRAQQQLADIGNIVGGIESATGSAKEIVEQLISAVRSLREAIGTED